MAPGLRLFSDKNELMHKLRERWPPLQSIKSSLLDNLAAPESEYAIEVVLVELCHAHEPHALEVLYSHFGRPLQLALETSFGSETAEASTEAALQHVISNGRKVYDGKGPLAKWLRLVATREAVVRARRGNRRRQLLEASEPLTVADASIELSLAKREASGQVATAVEIALTRLEPRQRLILKLHAVDEVPFHRIAPLFRVHRTTVARWYETALDQLQKGALAELKDRFRGSTTSAKELAQLVASQLSLSLERSLVGSTHVE